MVTTRTEQRGRLARDVVPDKRTILDVSAEEKQVLDACRSLKWGKVEVIIQDGRIVRMVRSESIKPIGKEMPG